MRTTIEWRLHGSAPAALLALACLTLPRHAAALEVLRLFPIQGGLQGASRAGWLDQDDLGRSQDVYWASRLMLRNRASLLDPGLLTMGINGSIGFYQNRIDARSVDRTVQSTTNTLPIEYDLSLNALGKSKLPTNMYASRSQQVVRVDIGGLSRVKSERAGGNITWRNDVLAPTISLSREQTDEEVRQGVTGITTRRQESTWRMGGNLRRSGPTTQFNTTFSHLDLDDEVEPTRNYATQDASLYHKAGVSNRFATAVHFSRRSPFLEQQRFSASEDLAMDHTAHLTSHHFYSFDRGNSQDTATATHTAKSGLSHKLFGSLQETVEFSASRQDFTGGRETAGGTSGRVAYRKEAGPGKILAGINGGYRLATRDAEPSPLREINESQTLEDGLPVLLTQRDADDTSIIVTDNKGEVIYQKGFDYDLTPNKGYVELTRLPGGRIREGEEVWVSYTYIVPGSALYDQRSIGYDLGYDLGWLRVYFQETRQGLHPIEGDIRPSEGRSTTVGAEGRVDTGRFLFTPLAERRGTRMDAVSYVTYVLRQPLALQWTQRSRLQLNLEEIYFQVRDADDFQTYSTELSATADYRLLTVRPGSRYWLRLYEGSERVWSNFVEASSLIGKLETRLTLDQNWWNILGRPRREYRVDLAVTRWF